MSTPIKNNSAALLAALIQLAGSSQTGGSQNGGKLSPENAAQLLKTLSDLTETLQKLQSSLGQKDGFGTAPGGPGSAGQPQAGGSSPIDQLSNLLKAVLELMAASKAGGPGAGAPGAGGPGAGAGALPFGDAASALNNLKQEQGALMGKIAEGVKSGKISPQELGPLLQGVKLLAQATKAASADGKITAGEAASLSQMSMNNVQSTKSAFENDIKSDFAALNPVAQQQAQQLGDISQGLMDGSISNAELTDLAGDQAEIANATGNISTAGDAAQVLTAQQLTGLEVQLARLSKVTG